jgi:hypothetical protein
VIADTLESMRRHKWLLCAKSFAEGDDSDRQLTWRDKEVRYIG